MASELNSPSLGKEGRSERLELKIKLREEEKKVYKLESELKLMEQKKENHTKKTRTLKEKVTRLEENYENEKKRSEKLEKERTDFQNRTQELEEEKDSLDKKLQRMESQLNRYKNSYESSVSEKERMKKIAEEEKEKQFQLKQKLRNQRKSLTEIPVIDPTASSNENEELYKENQDLREEIKTLRTEKSFLEEEVKESKRAVEDLESTVKKLKDDLKKKTDEMDQIKREQRQSDDKSQRQEEKLKEKTQRDSEVITTLREKVEELEKSIRVQGQEQIEKEKEQLLKIQQEVLITTSPRRTLARSESRHSTTAHTSEKVDKNEQIDELLKQPGAERVRVWEYHPDETGKWDAGKWSNSIIVVKVERRPFAEGSLRVAHYAVNLSMPDKKFVIKFSKNKSHTREIYENDVEMQTYCQRMSDKFNEKNPPKKTSYIPCHLIEMMDRLRTPVGHMEPLLDGEFTKYNNNDGLILTPRNTPQAFSHFTYEESGKQLVIVDVQGVDDLYTDPQIHTADYQGFGMGNLGQKGILKFLLTHQCNPVCRAVGLEPIASDRRATAPKLDIVPSGTMPKPDMNHYLDLKEIPDFTLPLPDDSPYEPITSNFEVVETLKGMRPEAFGVNDKYIFAGDDAKLKVFDRKTFELLQTLKGHTDSIETLCCNQKILFTGSADKDIRIWDQESWVTKKILDSHTGSIKALVFHNNILYSGSTDKTIRIRDIDSEAEEDVLYGHTKHVKSLVIAPNGKLLFSGSNDNSIKIWDLATKTCIFNFDGHTAWVTSLGLVGRYLVSSANDKSVKIWDIQELKLLSTFPKLHSDNINAVVATPNGIFTAGDDSVIQLLNLKTMKFEPLPKEHKGGIVSLGFDNRQLFSVAFDGMKIWSKPLFEN